jgi:hypothetical protein
MSHLYHNIAPFKSSFKKGKTDYIFLCDHYTPKNSNNQYPIFLTKTGKISIIVTKKIFKSKI